MMTEKEAVNRRFTLMKIRDRKLYILIDHFHLTEPPCRYLSEEAARRKIANRLWGTHVPVDDPENKIGNSATDSAELVRITVV